MASWDSIISSDKVNQLRFQWGRDLETADANAPGPSVSIPSVTVYGMANALPRPGFPDEHRWQFTDIFSLVKRVGLQAGAKLAPLPEIRVPAAIPQTRQG